MRSVCFTCRTDVDSTCAFCFAEAASACSPHHTLIVATALFDTVFSQPLFTQLMIRLLIPTTTRFRLSLLVHSLIHSPTCPPACLRHPSSYNTRMATRSLTHQIMPSPSCSSTCSQSLFAATDPPDDNYHHTSERHKIAPNPYFGEEYVIDLSEVWALLPDFRLHFSVWSDVEACSDGSGFLGCTSFGIDEIIRITTNVDVSGERPRWWW